MDWNLPVMRQKWRELAFFHWEVPVDALRPLVPRRLTIDTFEGRAFIGLVPFTISGVRPPLLPPMPWVSAFHEVNVRTYVQLEGRDPGVWFFSLDAARLLAVIGARASFRLPYFHASMEFEIRGDAHAFRSRRYSNGARCEVRWNTASGPERTAAPGSLDHFLIERYLLYASAGKKLLQARVRHRPYPLVELSGAQVEEDLIAAAGIAREAIPPPIQHASPGVDVDVFAPRAV